MKMTTFRSKPCAVCEKVTVMEVPTEKLWAWQNGELIQRAFPELSRTERETMMSGVCSDECWDKLWCTCAATGKEECPVHG